MTRFFNTTGPCDARFHYMLPAEARLPDLVPFVRQYQYFVVHAPRQTGKTTAMYSLAERLSAEGFVALVATLETAQGVDEVERAVPIWLDAIAGAASVWLPPDQRPPPVNTVDGLTPHARLGGWLTAWCQAVGRPVALLLDEADVVNGPALISLLRQLRAGFPGRLRGAFPASVGLIGMRDLRDYLTKAKDGLPVNPGSPFNITAGSFTLGMFTPDDVRVLYGQHTAETGQVFEAGAVERAWELTRGQPFLVNALANLAVRELVPDRTMAIGAGDVDRAAERLILQRTTHLDSLAVRLRDARVRPILQTILLGDSTIHLDAGSDDLQYVEDLGLIRRTPGGVEIANPMYREVLARELSQQAQLDVGTRSWLTASGRLDFPALVRAFLSWWRENADILIQDNHTGYFEATAQLAFMGFLQRVVNGGGTILREYAAGRGRIDLLVTYGPDRFVVELKRIPSSGRHADRVVDEGIVQLGGYLDTVGVGEGWLIVFDQRPDRSWEERLWEREVEVQGRCLHLRGA